MHIINQTTFYNQFKRLSDTEISKYTTHPLCQSLLIVSMGYYKKEMTKDHFVRKPANKEATIHYCLEGSGQLFINNQAYPVRAGDLFICPPETLHAYKSNTDNPWSVIWVYFIGEDVLHFLNMVAYKIDNPVMQLGIHSKIIKLFIDALNNYSLSNKINRIIYANQCIKELLSYLAILDFDSLQGYSNLIQDSIEYMHVNLPVNLTLDGLAERYHLSKDHYTKIFRKVTGSTPIDYFITLRIQHACALLETTTLPINEISKLIGYEDSYYFSRIFKKRLYYSPNKYRKLKKMANK